MKEIIYTIYTFYIYMILKLNQGLFPLLMLACLIFILLLSSSMYRASSLNHQYLHFVLCGSLKSLSGIILKYRGLEFSMSSYEDDRLSLALFLLQWQIGMFSPFRIIPLLSTSVKAYGGNKPVLNSFAQLLLMCANSLISGLLLFLILLKKSLFVLVIWQSNLCMLIELYGTSLLINFL